MHDVQRCMECRGKMASKYGRVRFNGRSMFAHRLVYAWANGVPLQSLAGLVVRHDCDNPACINPEHLTLGTQAENIADCIARGRARHRTPRGEDHFRSRLTDAAVQRIRVLLAGGKSSGEVARLFGVSKETIKDVKARRTWTHV